MSLDKAIEHGKERRKQYGKENGTYAKSIDSTCRNHGSCSYCRSNRMIKNRKREQSSESKLEDVDKCYCRGD